PSRRPAVRPLLPGVLQRPAPDRLLGRDDAPAGWLYLLEDGRLPVEPRASPLDQAPRRAASAADEPVRQVGRPDLERRPSRPGEVRRPLPLLERFGARKRGGRPDALLGAAAGDAP